ncbi:hypothetical protein [Saccharobesus litoralis]|nr:hypothetical protein [Saccharobesus litoralis]
MENNKILSVCAYYNAAAEQWIIATSSCVFSVVEREKNIKV